MIGRFLARIVNAQAAGRGHSATSTCAGSGALLRPIRPVKDFLNGKWLGHSIHAVLTDVPIGALTLVIIFDVLDAAGTASLHAADVTLAFGILAMSARPSRARPTTCDTDDEPRVVATVHATFMVVALVIYLVSLGLRLGNADRRPDRCHRAVGHRLPDRGLRGVGRRRGRLRLRQHGQSPRLAFRPQVELDQARRHRHPGEHPDCRQGRRADAGRRAPGRQPCTRCTRCARTPAARWRRARSSTAASSVRGMQSRFELATGRRKQGPTTYDQPIYEVRPAEVAAGRSSALSRASRSRSRRPRQPELQHSASVGDLVRPASHAAGAATARA